MASPDIEEIAPRTTARGRRLDEWYVGINNIYLGHNFHRSTTSIFAHLVEACGGMSRFARDDWVPTDVQPRVFFPKALAWWFALCAKVGVRSVEAMIWAKFPAVCSYCHDRPHDAEKCRAERETRFERDRLLAPDWPALADLAEANRNLRPRTIPEFVRMFVEIYDPEETNFAAAFARLNEELGELAEAVRVVEVAPHYFLSEAPDFFAWLVKCHCLVAIRKESEAAEPEDFRTEQITEAAECGDLLAEQVYEAYPDKCVECGRPLCVCPPLPRTTLGRLAAAGPTHEGTQFRPGRVFISLSQMLTVIEAQMVTTVEADGGTIEIRGESYYISAKVLSEFRTILDASLNEIEERFGNELKTILERLDRVVKRQEDAAVSEAINESRLIDLGEALTDVTRWVETQPTETRSEALSFLNGLSSNAVFNLLVAFARAVLHSHGHAV